ncbi:unnamed protein product [Heligmosomoides polygyrus]|uniref:J domain-containing protein n=1 Tax=Heligmosomoides polygyrus TaxID=6339 RepID=A0A3P8DJA0_HELPZ|nr:unnamed protein product [Heligmosomoides polygyrus]
MPETQNLFEYMGLPVSFNIEDSLLKKRFRELQFKLHPDRFARASEHEKELSDEHSRRLNESYKTLSEPLHRAKYLLKILGDTDIADKEKDLDESSLMEMMDWHERIAEMTTKRELTAENEKLQEEIDGLLAQLGRLFEDKNLDGVRETITRLSYLYSVRKLIDQRKEAMFAAG